jgi:hypothetical protein
MYSRIGIILCCVLFAAGCTVATDSNNDLMEESVSAEEVVVVDQAETVTEEVEETQDKPEAETVEIVEESLTNDKEETEGAVVPKGEKVQFIVKDSLGVELYDLFTIAFEEVETGKQIRKFPHGAMLVFEYVPAGEYNVLVTPVSKDGSLGSEYKSQSIPVVIDGNVNKGTRTISILADKKASEEIVEKEETPTYPQYQVTGQTVQFIVKDSQGNEVYDTFTIAFEEISTGKQIRKFPNGSMLVFNHVPLGEYRVLVHPVIKANEIETEYKSQTFDFVINSESTESPKTITVQVEKKDSVSPQ